MSILNNYRIRALFKVSLIFSDVILSVLGLLLMIVATWYHTGGSKYFILASSTTNYSTVAFLLIVIGLFFIILGVLGIVGAVLYLTTAGRILLLVHSALLVFTVICEVLNGITAFAMNDEVKNSVSWSGNSTFYKLSAGYDNYAAWKEFEQEFNCCGLNSFADWHYQNNGSLQQTCCASHNCTVVALTALSGCLSTVTMWTHDNMAGIAGVASTVGVIEVAAILASCFLALTTNVKS
ncbi:hypothetical protein EMCRGX_G023034 [Ephydatia muelleri]